MGVPTLFRHLFETYGLEIIKPNVSSCDYLFFDFNSILYNVYAKDVLKHQQKSVFIQSIFSELLALCQRMNPTKFVGIYFDGVAPRSKMIQQRSRRYKSILLQRLLSKEDEFAITNHICPGTEFMQELCLYLEHHLPSLKKQLSHRPSLLLSTVNVPGEGEHKIMDDIRQKFKFEETDSIVVMSPDNDLISLLMLNQNKNVLLMRYMDISFQKWNLSEEDSLFFISIDVIKRKFQQENKLYTDMENLLLDYNFLLSICGNDFVTVIPFMRIKNGGMDKLLSIYKNYSRKQNEYLIEKNNDFHVNDNFFLYIMIELSKMERYECKKWGSFIERERNHPDYRIDNDESLSKSQKKEAKINHLYLCNANHPLRDVYVKEFETLHFDEIETDFKTFKNKYYHYFISEFSFSEMRRLVTEYLKSLKYTLIYYNRGCPSESWYYPFRCAPFFSDVVYFFQRRNFDFTRLTFSNHRKYSPYEQLMMILPKESSSVLPTCFNNLFSKYRYNYPSGEYKVDALQGMKFIYSEVILKEWKYLPSVFLDIKNLEKYFTENEKKRNLVTYQTIEC